MRDIYLYPHTDVLKNKLNITDARLLEEAEANYVSMRLRELVKEPLPGEFDYTHFMNMHEYIFQDIYEWAGQPRKLNIFKEEPVLGGLSVEYADVFDIVRDVVEVLQRLNSRAWRDYDFDTLVKLFSCDVAALWKIHPFREGNTRTVITFCCQYANEHGFPINRQIFEDNSEYVRTALVAYNAVFHDVGDRSKPEYLETIMRDSLKSIRKML